jgi:hypothetical protein
VTSTEEKNDRKHPIESERESSIDMDDETHEEEEKQGSILRATMLPKRS